ncbi:hypothetical protein [Methylobacterium platani]|uniref:Uncharacterized protein n=2 Tax=Methylobacterium platani TaxID=427683 RepID=A0A179SHW9_9HYPH|nr:hypothetical protein [Methylobacterium platani]KMO16659.1 hypothetical protein SQ03_14235 [Methylobacterium platani JCM 14648]OAS26580.1 hypothetical protein A5481_05910 [Methylobacterium platani]
MTGRLWTSLARFCATALLGLGLAFLAVSAADAAVGRTEPVLRAAHGASPMASLHAHWVKAPTCTLTAGGVDNPRPDDGGAASLAQACAGDGPAASAATLLPPRRLGALAREGAALPERPPKRGA